MDRQRGDNYVVLVVRIHQLTRVAVFDSYAVADAFNLGVLARRVGGIAGEILRILDVDTGGFARFQTLGRADQHQAAAAADVQYFFIAFEFDRVEQPVA